MVSSNNRKKMTIISYSSFLLFILILAACSSDQTTDEPALEEEVVEASTQEDNTDEETNVEEEDSSEEVETEGFYYPEQAEVTTFFLDEEVKTLDDFDKSTFRLLEQDRLEPRLFLGDEEVIGFQNMLGLFRYDLSSEEEIWTAEEGILDGRQTHIENGQIYTFDTKGLVAFDMETGERLREYPIDLGHEPRPYFFDEYVILFNYDEMKAFDLHSAEELWTNPLGEEINTAIVENDEAFIFESELTLYTLEKDTGEIIWELERPISVSESSTLTHYPYVHEDSIFVQDYAIADRVATIIELDARTGDVLNEASFDSSHSGYREPLLMDNGILMPTDISQNGELSLLDFSLEEQWRIDHEGFVLIDYLYVDGMIYMVAGKGDIPVFSDYHLFVIDANTGEIEDAIEIGDTYNDPLYTHNGKVYVFVTPGDPKVFIYDYQDDTNRPFED